MHINLKLHSILREYLPPKTKGKATIELATNATVEDLLQHLNIHRDCIIMVNGEEIKSVKQPLQNGDDVQMLTALGGGL